MLVSLPCLLQIFNSIQKAQIDSEAVVHILWNEDVRDAIVSPAKHYVNDINHSMVFTFSYYTMEMIDRG